MRYIINNVVYITYLTYLTSHLFSGKSLNALPVALSMLVSYLSTLILLGIPAEVYYGGTIFWTSVFGAMLAPVTGMLVFGPLFHRLKIVSVNQVSSMFTSNNYVF